MPTIMSVLRNVNDKAPHINCVVIDTINGILTDKVMDEVKKIGHDKWRDLSEIAYELYNFIREDLRDDLIVYIMAHVEVYQEDGVTKYRTLFPGKQLTKLNMSGKLNYNLYTEIDTVSPGKFEYNFVTQTDGTNEARSSYGVLPYKLPNNLEEVRLLINKAEQ